MMDNNQMISKRKASLGRKVGDIGHEKLWRCMGKICLGVGMFVGSCLVFG